MCVFMGTDTAMAWLAHCKMRFCLNVKLFTVFKDNLWSTVQTDLEMESFD